jgi:ferredoxin
MRYYVNEKICTGCGRCSTICPLVFVHYASGEALALHMKVTRGRELAQAAAAVRSCPVHAIVEMDSFKKTDRI